MILIELVNLCLIHDQKLVLLCHRELTIIHVNLNFEDGFQACDFRLMAPTDVHLRRVCVQYLLWPPHEINLAS